MGDWIGMDVVVVGVEGVDVCVSRGGFWDFNLVLTLGLCVDCGCRISGRGCLPCKCAHLFACWM